MSVEQSELDLLHLLVPELEAEGYDVYLRPSKDILPEFLRKYSPDALAIRGEEKLIVEVKQRSDRTNEQVHEIKEILKGHPDWKLRLVWANPATAMREISTQSRDEIRTRVGEVRDLVTGGHLGAGLLIAWSAFEAAARALSPEEFRRPQTPGRMVSVLAASGVIAPREADLMRALIDKRNRLVHGELAESISRGEVESIADVVSRLADEIEDRHITLV
jgi:hypothetical protein